MEIMRTVAHFREEKIGEEWSIKKRILDYNN